MPTTRATRKVRRPRKPPSTFAPAAPTASITAVLQANNSVLVTWSTTNAVSAVINGTRGGRVGFDDGDDQRDDDVHAHGDERDRRHRDGERHGHAGRGGGADGAAESVGHRFGSRVSLAWRPPSGGGTPQTYLIYAGTTSGGTNVANGVSVATS